MSEARRLGRALALILCVALLLPAAGLADELSPAQKRVVDTVDEVFAILKQKDLPESERRKQIEDVTFSQFDFDTMSKLVLARHWKRFSATQREEYVREFKLLLSRHYGQRLDRFGDQTIEVKSELKQPRGDVTVRTEVSGGEFDGAKLDFRMRKKGENWRAIDVVIEGVSLVSNYRSQFADVVGKKGPEGLLKLMKEKNARPFKEDEAL